MFFEKFTARKLFSLYTVNVRGFAIFFCLFVQGSDPVAPELWNETYTMKGIEFVEAAMATGCAFVSVLRVANTRSHWAIPSTTKYTNKHVRTTKYNQVQPSTQTNTYVHVLKEKAVFLKKVWLGVKGLKDQVL